MSRSLPVARTRVLTALLAASLLTGVPAASAQTDAPISEPQPIDEPVIADPSPAPPEAEIVVYDMFFPIQGGASYTNNFGDCRGGSACPRTHEGIDILQPKMTPILAVASGTVGWINDEQGGDCCAFELNHDDGWESYYIHMNNDTPGTDDGQGWGFAPGIGPGARVEAGQLVGWVGDSGNAESTPPHLHYELHKPGGVVINPYDSLQAATVLNAPLGHGQAAGCDYNDDGYDDLAIGVPGEDLAGNSKVDAGAVTVIYGTATGLKGAGAVQITQGTPGVDSKAQSDEQFGFATACGDVNNDGFDDLVVGVPGETTAGRANAGAINLILGSSSGLEASGDNLWHQAKPTMATPAEAGDRFGEALAVGDFNGDGFADVAVGVPGEKLNGKNGAGMVAILYGSGSGFDGTAGDFSEAAAGIAGVAEGGDHFGASLAAGDFDEDGKDDLAIGIPDEDSIDRVDSGAAVVVYGSGAGLASNGSQRFNQNTAGIQGSSGNNEAFGAALVAADFDDDGKADLAIGVPGDAVSGINVGGVNVIYGSGSGLTASGSQIFHQDEGGIVGDSLKGDRFGDALAFGDFNGDGNQDLAVGAPLEDLGDLVDAGAVTLIYGSGSGLSATGNQMWSQDTVGVKGVAEENDRLGGWLSSGDFAGKGISALAVGVPLEDIAGKVDTGMTHIIKGKAGIGLSATGDQRWDQGDVGIPNTNESGDGFGRVGTVAAG